MIIQRYGVRAVAFAVITILLVIAILFGLGQCQSRRGAEKQGEVSKEQSSAATNSGQEALNTASNVSASDDETDKTVSQGQKDIENAVAGQKGEAARKAACRLKAYKDTPECQENQK